MTQEEKTLLLKDLCARLPYGVKVYNTTFKEPTIKTLYGKISSDEFLMEETYTGVGVDGDDFGPFNKRHYTGHIDFIKPYLRPMSSMTEEEMQKLERLINEKLNRNTDEEDDEWTPWVLHDTTGIKNSIGGERFYFDDMSFIYDWLNAHHFDYRGLIEKGLAIKVTEENNPYK